MGRACTLCTAPHGCGEEKPCVARSRECAAMMHRTQHLPPLILPTLCNLVEHGGLREFKTN